MTGLGDIRDILSSMFVMLNQKTYILFRIEFLVVLVTVLFLVMFVMDIFRRHIHSTTMNAIFSLFNAVSDPIIIYLLGAMQTAPFKNQLFPVWAIVLVMFRHSIDFISGYGVSDRGGRRFLEWRNVLKLLGSAFLNWTRGSRFAGPLWSLWALQILRSWYRLHCHTLASNSLWHGCSSELVSEYMHAELYTSNWRSQEWNPRTMKGYKYLVYGEDAILEKPRYVLRLKNTSPPSKSNVQQDRHYQPSQGVETTSSKTIIRSSLITLDRIWGCRRHLLFSDSNSDSDSSENSTQGKDLKDLSLAFALSRLLRCDLEDVTLLGGGIYHINRKLVKRRIIKQDVKRAFWIMELQLNFVNDYFNTRYPMVFWSGLSSLFISLVQNTAVFGVVLWLSVDIRKVYKPPEDNLANMVQGVNVDMIITWIFMFFIMFREIWEMVTYLLSDWTRLLLVCMYAKWDDENQRNRCMESIILSFLTSEIIKKRWHGLLDQYVFMQSYDDRPKFWNLLHKLTTGVVPKKENGAKLGSAINVPDYVRSAILKKLSLILEKLPNSEDLTADANKNSDDRRLPQVIMALSDDRKERYGWACFQLQTASQVILVWHIATSFCEMALAKKKKCSIDLSNRGYLQYILSCFPGCCPKPYLIDVDEEEKEKKKNIMEGPGFLCSLFSRFLDCCWSKSNDSNKCKKRLTKELKERYIIANSLSRYCGYLLVSKPDLIPDSFHVPTMIFQKTVKSACGDILKYCDSLESRYNKLHLEAYKVAPDSDSVKKGDDVLKQGIVLGKELLDNEGEEGCWDILAGVWVELLIHIAPTWNLEAHKKCLESGGEFITYIWALLWHCGIEQSNLWPEDDASENSARMDLHDIDVGNNNNNTVEETKQSCADLRNNEITEAHVEVEIVETKKPKPSNLRTGPRGLENIGSCEIEVSHD